MSPSPVLPLPPSSNDLIKVDANHSLLLWTSQWCWCHLYMNAASLSERRGLTGAQVEHSRAQAVLRCLTDWNVGEEKAAYLELNPPSLYSTLPSVTLPFFVTLSLVFIHFTFTLLLFSSHLFPLQQMETLGSLFLAISINTSNCLIPAREGEKKLAWKSFKQDVRVYSYGTEGVSALRAGPTPILCETSRHYQSCIHSMH